MDLLNLHIISTKKYSYEYLKEDILHVCDSKYKKSQFILLINSFNIYIKHCINDMLAMAIRCLKPLPAHLFLKPLVLRAASLVLKVEDLVLKIEDLVLKAAPLTLKIETLILKIEVLALKIETLVLKAAPLTLKIEDLVLKAAPLTLKIEDLVLREEPLTLREAETTSHNRSTKYKYATLTL